MGLKTCRQYKEADKHHRLNYSVCVCVCSNICNSFPISGVSNSIFHALMKPNCAVTILERQIVLYMEIQKDKDRHLSKVSKCVQYWALTIQLSGVFFSFETKRPAIRGKQCRRQVWPRSKVVSDVSAGELIQLLHWHIITKLTPLTRSISAITSNLLSYIFSLVYEELRTKQSSPYAERRTKKSFSHVCVWWPFLGRRRLLTYVYDGPPEDEQVFSRVYGGPS